MEDEGGKGLETRMLACISLGGTLATRPLAQIVNLARRPTWRRNFAPRVTRHTCHHPVHGKSRSISSCEQLHSKHNSRTKRHERVEPRAVKTMSKKHQKTGRGVGKAREQASKMPTPGVERRQKQYARGICESRKFGNRGVRTKKRRGSGVVGKSKRPKPPRFLAMRGFLNAVPSAEAREKAGKPPQGGGTKGVKSSTAWVVWLGPQSAAPCHLLPPRPVPPPPAGEEGVRRG